jgi:hypothetical protein
LDIPAMSLLSSPDADVAKSPDEGTNKKWRERPIVWTGSLFFFGCLLPMITLLIEVSGHLCGSVFFDPIPSWWNVVAIAVVPLANACALHRLSNDSPRLPRWLVHAQGFAIGVSAIYALLFLPLIFHSVIGVFVLGMGLLPLSPLFACLASIRIRSHLRVAYNHGKVRIPSVIPGVLAGVALLGMIAAQSELTLRAMERAASGDPATRNRALWQLRWFGSENTMLRACYGLADWRLDFFKRGNFLPANTAEMARATYYRVTGNVFDSQSVPRVVGARWSGGWGDWNWDEGLGGERVAGKVPYLSLSSSRMDGQVQAAAALAYTEWTLVFKNQASAPNEARAQIELPPGGVVSRLTLWINGEPREAAFGGRAQVRAAYQEVAVRQRRDPVLVTVAGPDRILMQCFPVPANGGEMKVRLGITAPLVLDSSGGALLPLPRFVETNFKDDGVRHQTWFESDAPVAMGASASAATLRMELPEAELRAGATLRVRAPAAIGEVYADDPTDPAFAIRQAIEQRNATLPARLVVVVDGSKGMKSSLDPLPGLFSKLPDGLPFHVIFAGDEAVSAWEGFRHADAGSRDAAAQWLGGQTALGGTDNLRALLRAWDAVAGQKGSAILWLHGPQPVLLSSVEALLQYLERGKHPPVLFDCPLVEGPNRIAEAISQFSNLQSVGRRETPVEAVRALFSRWAPGATEPVAVRTRIPATEVPTGARKADRHIARLWANEEAARLHSTGGTAGASTAVKLAVSMQLVTALTGAVVLETKAQYERHQLEAADPNTVPVVPEPAGALLLAMGSVAVLLKRRRASGQPK